MGRRAHAERTGPLLLVCSCGGHLLQLTSLRDAFAHRERVWVTFDKADARSLLRDEQVIHAFGPTNRNIPNAVRNLRLAWSTLRRVRPAAMVSTGAGVAVPFAWTARAMGIPVIYVESVTRIESLSLSGRMIRPIATDLFVQWPDLAERVDGACFAGNQLVAS